MRMGRMQFAVSVVANALVIVVGIYLGLTKAGTDSATFGWVLAVLGAIFLVSNLVVRDRLR